MRIATFKTFGIHAWKVVQLRQVAGAQRFVLIVTVEYEDDETISHTIIPAEPVMLSDLADLAAKTIAELTQVKGPKISKASMEFLIRRTGQ